MLEARIISPRGSLYIAAEATPYDVQQLRSHVHALRTANSGDVRLTLRLGPSTRARVGELVAALAATLTGEGVCVTVDDAPAVRDDRAPHPTRVGAVRRLERQTRRARSRVA